MSCMVYAFDKYMEEVTDANSYLVKALEMKESNPKMATSLHAIALDEIKHAKAMRDMVNNEFKATTNNEQKLLMLETLRRHRMNQPKPNPVQMLLRGDDV